MSDIKESELKEFVDWFFTNFDRTETCASVITTCMCGHFHISPKKAKRALKRCFFFNLLRRAPGKRIRQVVPRPRDPWWEKWEKRHEPEKRPESELQQT